MNVKIFTALTERGLEDKVNNFILRKDIEVVRIDFSARLLGCAVMVSYKMIMNNKTQ